MRHPGVGIGIGGVGVGLGTFVLQAAAVELPSKALVALGVVAVLMVVGGFALEFTSGASSPGDQNMTAGRGDQESVRALLDEAAVALHTTAYVLDQVRLRLTQLGPGFFKGEEGARRLAELGEAGEKLDSLLERLKVRFHGRHGIVVAFERADEATLAIYRALELLKLEPEADAGDEYARRQVRELFDEKRTEIHEQRSEFDSQRAAFIDAASARLAPNYRPTPDRTGRTAARAATAARA